MNKHYSEMSAQECQASERMSVLMEALELLRGADGFLCQEKILLASGTLPDMIIELENMIEREAE